MDLSALLPLLQKSTVQTWIADGSRFRNLPWIHVISPQSTPLYAFTEEDQRYRDLLIVLMGDCEISGKLGIRNLLFRGTGCVWFSQMIHLHTVVVMDHASFIAPAGSTFDLIVNMSEEILPRLATQLYVCKNARFMGEEIYYIHSGISRILHMKDSIFINDANLMRATTTVALKLFNRAVQKMKAGESIVELLEEFLEYVSEGNIIVKFE